MKFRLISKTATKRRVGLEDRYLRFGLVLVSIAGLLLILDSSLIRPHVFEAFGLRDIRTEIDTKKGVLIESALINEAVQLSKVKLQPCSKFDENKVSETDIADYLGASLGLLQKISEADQSLSKIAVRNKRTELFNSLVTESQKQTEFYNSRLVRCYSKEQDALMVSKRADTVRVAIDILREKL